MHNIKRLLSCSLILVLIMSLLPLDVLLPVQAAPKKQPRELIEQRTDKTKIIDNGDGTYTKKLYTRPIHRKKGERWEEISSKLTKKEDTQTIITENTSLDIQFYSKMTNGQYASLQNGADKMVYRFLGANGEKDADARDVTPVFEENRITYENSIEYVNLRNIVFNDSVKEDIILTEYAGYDEFEFQINTGLEAKKEVDGSISFINKESQTVFTIPKPFMVDSNIDEHSGEAQRSENVSYDLKPIDQNQGYVLTVKADRDWLKDPARKYPVFIDPSTEKVDRNWDAFVSDLYPGEHYDSSWEPSCGCYVIKVGYYDGAGTNVGFLKTDLPDLRNYDIDRAELKLFTQHSYNFDSGTDSSLTGIWLDTVNNSFNLDAVRGSDQIASTNIAKTDTVRGRWASFDVTNTIRSWMSNPSANFGFKLHTNGNGYTYWKKFHSSDNYGYTSYIPYLDITYRTKAPTLSGSVSGNLPGSGTGYVDLRWAPVPNAEKYMVHIFNGAHYEVFDVGNVTQWSTQNQRIWPTQAEISSGRYQLHHDGLGQELATDPSPVYRNAKGSPEWGYSYGNKTNYYFRVTAYSSQYDESSLSNVFTPTILNRSEDLGTQEYWSLAPVPKGQVNASNGNLVMSRTDLSIPGRGPAVTIARTYNSRSTTDGPFGLGWSFNFNLKISEDVNGNAIFTKDDGATLVFPKDAKDGSYLRPLGYAADLTKDANGYTVTTKDKTKLFFNSSGTLTKIQDTQNNAVTFTYNASQTIITDASGRTTSIQFDANKHITSITDPSGRIWKYGYSGSLLTSVEAPEVSENKQGQASNVRTVVSYQYQNNVLTTILDPNHTDAKPVKTSFVYQSGKLANVTDPLGNKTQITYDSGSRQMKITHANGSVNGYAFNEAGNPVSQAIDANGLNLLTTYVYDHNRLIQMTDPNSNAGDKTPTLKYTLDANGNVTEMTDPYGSKKFTYDGDNKVVQYTDANGETTKNTYDGFNLISSANPAKVTNANVYDANGNVLSSTSNVGVADNLLANPEFEKSAASFTGNWTSASVSDSGSVVWDVSRTRSGQSYKITSVPSSTAWGYQAAIQDVTVKPNSTYTISSYLSSSLPIGAKAFLNVYQMDSAGNAATGTAWVDNRSEAVSGSTNWIQKQLTFTTGPNAAKIRVYMQVEHSNTTMSGTAWFDQVRLVNQSNGSSPSGWTGVPTNDSGFLTVDPVQSKKGLQSLKLVSRSTSNEWGQISATQEVSVKPNTTYTLSGQVKTDILPSNSAAFFNVFQMTADNQEVSNPWFDNRYSRLTGTNDWTEKQLRFTTGANTSKVRIYLELEHSGYVNGTAWFESLQLEEGPVSTRVNPLENSSFEQGLSSWATTNGTGTLESAQVFDGKQALKMTRTASSDSAVQYRQSIVLNQKAPSPITISGMSKAQDVVNPVDKGLNQDYSIWTNAFYSDGTVDKFQAKFALGTHEWQRASESFHPQKPIQYLDIYVLFRGNNTGTVWFDNIRLAEGQNSTKYTYEAKGNYVTATQNPLQHTTTAVPDGIGNVLSSTDPRNNTQSFEYDKLNQLRATNLPGYNTRLNYYYDPSGNLYEKLLTSQDQQVVYSKTSFQYNENNQLVATTAPNGKSIGYEYDKNGNVTKVTYPSGDVKNLSYDGANRNTDVLYNGTLRYRFEYDSNGNKTRVSDKALGLNRDSSHDKANRLTAIVYNSTSALFSYDANGNIKQQQVNNVGGYRTTDFSYNSLNQNTLVVAGEKKYRFDYDEAGSLRNFVNANSSWTHNEFDDNSQLTHQVSGKSDGTILSDLRYTYDGNGNRISSIDKSGVQLSYAYDSLDQLTSETDPLTRNSLHYAYDDRGNLIKKTVKDSSGAVLSSTDFPSNNPMNQLTSFKGNTLKYDERGNLTDDGEKLFSWDMEGRLIKVQKKTDGTTIAQYWYDEMGRRIRSVVNGKTTDYVYQGIRLLYETDGTDNITRVYTYNANGQLLSMTESSGTYYYHINGHGDVTAVTDGNNNVVATYVYDAWGNILKQEGSFADKNPFRYAGYRYDQETGLYYLMARYYNPQTARFISIDADPGDKTDPLSQNLYSYARNNPVRYSDPNGCFFVDAAFLIYDIGILVRTPSAANLAWVAADIVMFADPTGTVSTAAHAARGANLAIDAAQTAAKVANPQRERGKAVSKAWELEKALIEEYGRGTRDWTEEEIELLLSSNPPRVPGYEGHHINSVKGFPEHAGNPDNIMFLTRSDHLMAHGGNWRNTTTGEMIDRRKLLGNDE